MLNAELLRGQKSAVIADCGARGCGIAEVDRAQGVRRHWHPVHQIGGGLNYRRHVGFAENVELKVVIHNRQVR